MISSFHQWLAELEEALRRMIGGVFLFFSEWLPTWIYEFIINGVWPVMIRLARVSLLACLWLFILFCPFMPGFVFTLSWWWKCGSTAWLVMAAVGSYWGLRRLAKKAKASVDGSETTAVDGLSAGWKSLRRAVQICIGRKPAAKQ
jgi:hypothetical protein